MRQVSSDHLDQLFDGNDKNYRLAKSLFKLGLRMPHVERLTQLPSLHLRRLLKTTGGSSPSGLLPTSIAPLLRGRPHVHYSLIVRLWRDSQHESANYAERFTIVFETYLALTNLTLSSAVVTADQAIFGIQQFECKRVRLVSCQRCGADTAMAMETPGRHVHCGMCKMGRPTTFQVEGDANAGDAGPRIPVASTAARPAPRRAEVHSISSRDRNFA